MVENRRLARTFLSKDKICFIQSCCVEHIPDSCNKLRATVKHAGISNDASVRVTRKWILNWLKVFLQLNSGGDRSSHQTFRNGDSAIPGIKCYGNTLLIDCL